MKSAPLSSPDAARSGQWLAHLAKGGGVAGRLSLALPLVAGGLVVAQAWALAGILHRAIVGGEPVSALGPTIGVLAAILVLRLILGTAGEIAAVRAGETIKAALRSLLVRDIAARRPAWTTAQSSGALSGLMLEQVEAFDGYLTRYIPAMLQAAILPLAFAAIVFPIDWVVGVLFAVTAPLIPVFMALAGWGAEAASRRQASALSRLSGHFADRLRGLTTLKLFGRGEAEIGSVFAASEELRTRTMRVMRIAFLSSAVLEFFAALGVAGVALYVGLTLLDLVTLRASPLTLEAGLFCLLLAPEVYQPLRLLAANYHDRAAAKAAAGEIERQLGALPSLSPTPAAAVSRPAQSTPVEVALKNVSIASPIGRPVIANLTLDIAARAHIAILGASGSGKSTLLEALAGLRSYEGGIHIGGSPITAPAPDRIAVLGQRPHIFAGSIADNIRLGRRTACDTAVHLAARRAQVTSFTDDLPDGLDTELGENGLGLSGGEIHRVALARLYLRDPGLLLLDEPTAHLDAATEAAVLDGLMEYATGRTLIVATHSDEVAARMQRVYRIAGGRLLPALRPNRHAPRQLGAA
jgi:ATP-binding cassette, subfamily C, bacterial CydD